MRQHLSCADQVSSLIVFSDLLLRTDPRRSAYPPQAAPPPMPPAANSGYYPSGPPPSSTPANPQVRARPTLHSLTRINCKHHLINTRPLVCHVSGIERSSRTGFESSTGESSHFDFRSTRPVFSRRDLYGTCLVLQLNLPCPAHSRKSTNSSSHLSKAPRPQLRPQAAEPVPEPVLADLLLPPPKITHHTVTPLHLKQVYRPPQVMQGQGQGQGKQRAQLEDWGEWRAVYHPILLRCFNKLRLLIHSSNNSKVRSRSK